MYNSINFGNYVKQHESNRKDFTINNAAVLSSGFLQFCVELLGSTTPPTPDVEGKRHLNDWYNGISPSGHIFKNEVWSRDQLVDLLKFLAEIPFSKYYTGSQNQDKQWNSSVPIFMYAQRAFNDIPYNDWNTVKNAKNILPSCFLHDIGNIDCLGMIENQPSGGFVILNDNRMTQAHYTIEDLLKFRVTALTNPKTQKRNPTTAFILYKVWRGTDEEDTGEGEIGEYEFKAMLFDGLPKIYRMALLQIWIFNPQIRLVKKSLLDLQNWDNIPEPFEMTAPESVITAKSETAGALW